jgi:asparagine synthase (glutamine-hydrolysing)
MDLQGAIEEFAYYSDEPSADAGALPVWFLSKLCKTRTTVALSGEGADELFGGYLTYRANDFARYLRNLPPAVVELLLAALRLWPVSNEKISFEYKLKRLLEGSLMPPERAHVYWNGTFSDTEKRGMISVNLPAALEQILAELREALRATKQDLGAYLWFDQKYYLPDDILIKSDRMSMAHAVELRPPFLDNRIVEFAATLPASLKIRGSQQKFVLKELMRSKLPQSVVKRKKIGFDIPAHEWVRGPLRSLVVDTLHEGLSDHPEIFNSDAIEKSLRDHLEKRINIGYHLWGLMILFLWMKKWHIQAPASSTAARSFSPAGVSMSI